MIYEVVAGDGSVLALLDDSQSCTSNPPCGGCDDCMLRQASFYGYKLREKPKMERKELDWIEVGF